MSEVAFVTDTTGKWKSA